MARPRHPEAAPKRSAAPKTPAKRAPANASATRRSTGRGAVPRRSQRRPPPTRRLVAAAALAIAVLFAGGLVFSLIKVTRAPAPTPFHFPPPAGGAASSEAAPGQGAVAPGAAPAEHVAPHP
ncbi:MAG: hypothetical protein ABI629_25285 [bacterium]